MEISKRCSSGGGGTVVALWGVIVAALVKITAAQIVHVVGDKVGWSVPISFSYYSIWASTRTFVVGHILTFNFDVGRHDVAQVPKASFETCSDGGAALSIVTAGQAKVTLKATGGRFFICTVGTHCSAGQKLHLTIVSAAPYSSPPSPVAGEPTAGNLLQPSPLSPPSCSSSPEILAVSLLSIFIFWYF